MSVIKILDNDIKYAENILFRKTGVFDKERIDFIKNLKTIDLQAVPGSGKTTAILAKLLILEKYLPFKDGSGILVISHTNAAIDEIKDRIEKYCPKLFAYPNFVGTIQCFVDTFLAIPFYVNKFKTKPVRIDVEIYEEQVEKFYENTNNKKLKNWLKRQRDSVSFLKSIRISIDEKLIEGINGKPENFKLKDSTKYIYKAIKKFKEDLLKRGYLHYDDAYLLAEKYISEYPKIIKLLQKRFKFVFVDEFQDMDKHQYELLEKIFYDNGNSISVYQRIGDKNQAIFNEVKLDDIWKQRNIHYLKGSHRLIPQIAKIVDNLALTPNKNGIEGRRKNKDGTDIDIKPHIIVYNDSTVKNVIPKFAEIIKKFQDNGKIPKKPKHKFMAIGWIKKIKEENKITIPSYWNDFVTVNTKKQINYKTLKDYLVYFEKDKNTLNSIRKNILNAFLKILRLEDIKDERKRNFSQRKFLVFLKDNFSNEYENFKLNIYRWSINIIKGELEKVYESIKEYIPTLLKLFNSEINYSKDFINSDSQITNTEENKTVEQVNIYEINNIKIEIGTVHSAKGQTHTATLYLETYYQGKYESEYLKDAISGNNFNPTGKYQKQAAKMAYVGLSRPTHLLCFAVHKDRFDKYLKDVDKNCWKIINLTGESHAHS